ncbi:hypothetical protein [Streptomyces venezuelae]|uniref:Uncharacterized protein n=1 Tax=Streptomyces venezuelae TaxID=54571 RepID=A0A5P2BBV0_STRVZ|nr:hypothetical protein [Streptomyces venezuelae]QES25799.1 hypothetical protein DEJ47_04450 [Streptomyces venezuelae]
MPTTDDYGQGIGIAALTDPPDASKLAKDIVNPIASRSTMRFASSSERAATLVGDAAPVEGMVTWLRDVDLLTVYDGSSWSVIGSGTKAWTTISLASGFAHNGNSNGTLQYRIVNLFGEDTLMLRGGVNITYSGSPKVIPNSGFVTNTPLVTAARPSSLRSLTGACSTTDSDVLSVKIDIGTDGRIQIVGTTSATADPKIQPPWVSFNGKFCSL